MKEILVFLLFVISFVVACLLLIEQKAPWGVIALYWFVLTIKNWLDFRGDQNG